MSWLDGRSVCMAASGLALGCWVDTVWQRTLNALGYSLLHRLGHHRLARGVGDLAGLLVGICVVDAIWELVLQLGGGGLLDAVGNGRLAGGVGDTLASLVLLGGAGARHVYLFCVVVVVVCFVLCCVVLFCLERGLID